MTATRANVGSSLNHLEHLVAEVRPKASDSLDNLNGLLTDARPKVSASLKNVQELTTKLGPLLDDLKTTTARANDTLTHVDSTLMENRSDVRTSVTGLRDTVAKSALLLTELNQTLDHNSTNIDDLLNNIRMTTENLRALTETLKYSPASLIRGVRVPDRKPGEIRNRRRRSRGQEMRLIISTFLVMAAVLCASCVATRPVRYYTIEPASPTANQGKPDGLVLLVGNITTPAALQDGRIRYRNGSNESGAYEYHRWTEQPGAMVRLSLLRALRASGNYQRVLEPGSLTAGDYLLQGQAVRVRRSG